MGEADFTELAGLLARILRGDGTDADGQWREAVAALRSRFTDMHYCLD